MEPTRRSHACGAIIRYRSRPFLKISLALCKVPLAASEPLGVSAQLGGSSGPCPVASVVGIRNSKDIELCEMVATLGDDQGETWGEMEKQWQGGDMGKEVEKCGKGIEVARDHSRSL
ncbi:hypothetical protein EDB89DRAFT_1912959 [Lactarius sanguifluus]|nr:hypothetical protein EDB89DRAFT_1912959 [Lactarius sanguifluus]